MPDGSFPIEPLICAKIGPNAILQLADPVDRMLGQGAMAHLLKLCRVPMPTGFDMVPQDHVARVHNALRQLFPDHARTVSEQAGRGTAQYICAHRIPKFARVALRFLPRRQAEKLLSQAISDHAWTFCGSGRLEVHRQDRETHFVITDNPLADIHGDKQHPCHWHAAVFAELFSTIFGCRYRCEEISCRGCHGALCRFVVRREPDSSMLKGVDL